jgi:hypothetical protein
MELGLLELAASGLSRPYFSGDEIAQTFCLDKQRIALELQAGSQWHVENDVGLRLVHPKLLQLLRGPRDVVAGIDSVNHGKFGARKELGFDDAELGPKRRSRHLAVLSARSKSV